jgi:hypothetical protein
LAGDFYDNESSRAMSDPRAPRRAFFGGVKRAEYERLLARDDAREARLAEALEDAETVVDELDAAVAELARLASAEVLAEDDAALALRQLLPRRAAAVELLAVERLPAAMRERLASADSGVVTFVHERANAAGEHALDSAAALVGERAVVVRYAEGVYDDGRLRTVVERLCHALAASVAARDVARDGRRRQPVTLLGGTREAAQLTALREAQGQPTERVTIPVAAGARNDFVGLFGEPAWHGELFDLAQALDAAARQLGGEAFELEDGFVCVVARGSGDEMRKEASGLIAVSSVKVELDGS